MLHIKISTVRRFRQTMSIKIFITVLFTIFLIEGNRCELIDEAISTSKNSIRIINAKIDTQLQTDGLLIGQTRASIGKAVNVAETNINSELVELDDVLQQAQENGEDISKCVNQEETDLASLDERRLDLCSHQRELDLIGIELGNLRILKKTLSNSVNLCLAEHREDVDAFKKCVQTDIDSAENSLRTAQSKIKDVADEALANASNCVEEVFRELDKTITTAANNLKQCLVEIL